jgi:hypothetical protein
VGTKKERTGIGRKERKKVQDYATRRERRSNTCGMDMVK